MEHIQHDGLEELLMQVLEANHGVETRECRLFVPLMIQWLLVDKK